MRNICPWSLDSLWVFVTLTFRSIRIKDEQIVGLVEQVLLQTLMDRQFVNKHRYTIIFGDLLCHEQTESAIEEKWFPIYNYRS